jgi:hypothetical protein
VSFHCLLRIDTVDHFLLNYFYVSDPILMKSFLFATGASLFLGFYPVTCDADDSKKMMTVRSDSEARWEIQTGFGVRQSFDLRYSSISRDLTGGYYSSAQASAAVYGSIGPVNAEANRTYDDGFVNIGSNFNLTTNWGYSDASQVRRSSQQWNLSQPWDSPGNNSLYLFRAGAIGTDAFERVEEMQESLFPYVEIHRVWKNDPGSFWNEIGLSGVWSRISTGADLATQLGMLQTRVLDEYFLYGIIPPAAPYSGPVLPPGPLLDNMPHSRVEDTSASGLSGVSFTDLNIELQTVSLGGIWRHDPEQGGWLDDQLNLHGVDLQAGLSLNYARVRMNSSTTIYSGNTVIGNYTDQASRSKFLPGFYASLGTTFDVGGPGKWMVFNQLRYDYAGKIKMSTGASSAEVALNGFSLTLGIGIAW